MAWQKQALHGEISEPERISHPDRHKVQQLLPMAILSSVSLAKSRKGSSALSMCQTAANAWSIAASVLGSSMSVRRFSEVIGSLPEKAKAQLASDLNEFGSPTRRVPRSGFLVF